MEPAKPPSGMGIWDALLTLFWGSVLTYFFFEPISGFVQSLLP